MPSKDYYAILGVKRDASDDEIKKAFRRLAHEHHPDKGGDQQKFKNINEAYQVVGDQAKRATYDQFGSAAFEQGGWNAGQGAAGFGGFDGFNIKVDDLGDFGDVLGSMFGFGEARRSKKTSKGADIATDLTIEFLESVKGGERTLKLFKHVPCAVCKGSGAEPGSKIETCKTCEGRGQVRQTLRTVFGMMQHATTCTECDGEGSVPSSLCRHCNGTGIERKTIEMKLVIPPGMRDGEALKLTGEGEYTGHGGRAGDLYVRVTVKPHPLFTRDGNNVCSTIHVPYSLLTLGGETSVETVDGQGTLKIPEATTAGTVFKLRSKGFPTPHSNGRGDHLVTLQPIVHRKITKEQRRALDTLRELGL